MNRYLLIVIVSAVPLLRGQDHPPNVNKTLSWSVMQLVPSVTWTAFPAATHFAFEWEATPVLYSFGLTDLVSPWKFFEVTPTARFTGSVEAMLTAQVYTTNPGSTAFGYSGQLLAHVPVVERGEYLALVIGAARYSVDGAPATFVVAGASTFFGMLQGTVKYAPHNDLWMTSLEFRLF